MKKLIVKFDSMGSSGNIFWIVGATGRALRKQGRITDFNNMRNKVHNSSSYDEALTVIREYVDLIDIRGVK